MSGKASEGIQVGADLEEHVALDKRLFVMAQDVIAKDKMNEEKENRRRMHLLVCINNGRRVVGKEEM